MRISRVLLGLAASALCVLFSGPSHGYCLTRTCDPKTQNAQCEFDAFGCNQTGKPLVWPTSCVSFDVQKDGSVKSNISYDQLHQVVINAFAQWKAADCGNGMGPSIDIADYGPVDCAKPEYNKAQPNANVITFRDNDWPYVNAVDTLALTTVYFNPDTGDIYDANVEINSFEDSFVVQDPVGAEVDLNAVLTHELGHFLGLSHSGESTATMFSSYMAGMATIEQDDVTGICLSLPPGRSTASEDCTPRHGFSGECAKPQTGCCATAVGTQASPGQTLALFAFGLGLCSFQGRRRLRRSARALRR